MRERLNFDIPLPPETLREMGYIRRSDYCRVCGLARSTGCERVRAGWPDARDTKGYSWIRPQEWMRREPLRRGEVYYHLLDAAGLFPKPVSFH